MLNIFKVSRLSASVKVTRHFSRKIQLHFNFSHLARSATVAHRDYAVGNLRSANTVPRVNDFLTFVAINEPVGND